jgi:hypothetical protein
MRISAEDRNNVQSPFREFGVQIQNGYQSSVSIETQTEESPL